MAKAYRILQSLAGCGAAEWDRLAGDNPFVSHAFLLALERSGSIGAGTGWQAHHIAALDADGCIVGLAPAYLKSHSYGEYVFDHGWAEAFERAGGRYYPKLQIASPFTPVSGPRLMAEDAAGRQHVLEAIMHECTRLDLSSAHMSFCSAQDWHEAAARGWLRRQDRQYHWLNEGYATFEDFLSTLQSRKRKLIRRERREALAAGLTVETLSGDDLAEGHWDAFYAFYRETGSRKWGRPYLTRRFFSLIGESMKEVIVLVLAKRDGRPIAGALNMKSGTRLYGRNWGALEHHPFLHFELCYYRAMDHAIAHGLSVVEAGAQGEHKLMRGYRPTVTHSAHHIRHGGLRGAVADFLVAETAHMDGLDAELNQGLPFRHAMAAIETEEE